MPETIAKLNPAQLNAFVEAFNAWQAQQQAEPVIESDGNAAFLEPMTDEEYAKWEHDEDRGWKKVYDRLLRRN